MPVSARIKSGLRSLLRKAQLDQELDEELQSAVDLLTDEKIRQGQSPARARREARLELGGVEQVGGRPAGPSPGARGE